MTYTRSNYIEDVTCLAAFLIYLESDDPKAVWGGRKVRHAVNALANIMQVDPAMLREKILLEGAKPGDDRHD